MAAGEDQTEAIILNLFIFAASVIDERLNVGNKIALRFIETCPSAHAINGLNRAVDMSHGRGLSGMPV
jgi:hypothetical protein